jgi:hypothetical protein
MNAIQQIKRYVINVPERFSINELVEITGIKQKQCEAIVMEMMVEGSVVQIGKCQFRYEQNHTPSASRPPLCERGIKQTRRSLKSIREQHKPVVTGQLFAINLMARMKPERKPTKRQIAEAEACARFVREWCRGDLL